MKVARFEHAGSFRYGTVADDVITPLREDVSLSEILGLAATAPAELGELPTSGEELPVSDVRLVSLIERPGKILGIGLNYRDHAAETGREPPSVQTWFNKQSSSINDPFGQVWLPAVSDALDYETELVVVIGRRGRHVPRDRAHEIIAGYMCGCDYSVRDWQRATPTMIMGKGFDTHAPVGPWLTTADEIDNLAALRLRCLVNGEVRQDGLAGDMIFDISAQIEHLTKAFPLEPGDLLFTGTPAGVGVARTPPAFLKDGDVVRVEIDGLGAIEQRIAKEQAETAIG